MKTIPLSQIPLLEKMLGMTTSSVDAEALVAIRKVNRMLKEHDITWKDLLSRQISAVDSFEPAPATSVEEATNKRVQAALDELRGVNLGKVQEFFDSLDEQWSRQRYLSPDQRRGLFKVYEVHKRRRA